MKPRSAPWRTVGSIPISVAIPQIMKEIMPQSRSAMLKGVPSKADIEILSKIASSALTPSSGASSKPALPRRNPVNALPRHRLAQLKDARELRWQRHVSQEHDTEVVPSCNLQDFQDLAEDLGTVRQLRKNTGLHVVDDKCAPVGAGGLLERFWNLKACGTHRINLAWAKGGQLAVILDERPANRHACAPLSAPSQPWDPSR